MSCPHCEELEEQVRQLKDELYNIDWHPPPWLSLTRAELAIVRTLLARDRIVTDETLFQATRHALGKEREDHTTGTAIKVWISKIRSKFAPHGLNLINQFGFGYSLPAETRAALLNWQDQEAA